MVTDWVNHFIAMKVDSYTEGTFPKDMMSRTVPFWFVAQRYTS